MSFPALSRTVVAYGVLLIMGAAAATYWYLAPQEEGGLFVVELGGFLQEVSASGKVESAEKVDLGFSQGGRVGNVYVRVGETVNEGDLLASIDQRELRASLLQKQALAATQRARLVELEQGTRPEEIAVADAEVGNKKAVFAQAEQAVIEALQESYVVAQDALLNRIDQFVLNPRSDYPEIIVSIDSSTLLSDFSKARVALEDSFAAWGPVRSTNELVSGIVTSRKNLLQLSDLLSIAALALSRAVPTITYPSATILSYAADVATARTNVQNTLADLTLAETAYRTAQTGLATSEKNLALKQAGTVAASIAAQRAQVSAAEADVAAAEALLGKTEIRAPFEGVVTVVDAKVGAIVSAGAPAVSMIGLGGYQVESYIPEINIALISVGDVARVTLDAYGAGISFLGRVVAIDPAETIRDGVSTYRVVLAFDSADERIRPGMTANVVITTDRREGVISIPQGLVRTRGGQTFVLVNDGGEIRERAITTGMISSLGTVEIVSGLKIGEVLPLLP